jgi:hypothetical protein
MRPRWRWWLWCAAFELWWVTGWTWLGDVYAWALDVPEWWTPGEDFSGGSGEVPW